MILSAYKEWRREKNIGGQGMEERREPKGGGQGTERAMTGGQGINGQGMEDCREWRRARNGGGQGMEEGKE